MGCSTSKSAATLLGSSSELQRVKKKLGKSHSFAPLRSSQLMSDHNMMPMHYDYHVVALTSSTYGIMKLVEAEKYAVNDEELLESNLVSAGCDHHPPAAAAAAPGIYSKIMRKSDSMPARSSKPAPHQTWTDMAMGISRSVQTIAGSVKTMTSKELQDHEEEHESVKTPLKNEISSCSDNWEQEELETINTWELMAGLDDLTPRPSPLPVADPPALQLSEAAAASHDGDSSLQKDLEMIIKPVLAPVQRKKGSKTQLSRSRSLSSIEDLKAAASTVVELEMQMGERMVLLGKAPAHGPAHSVSDSSSQTLFSKFSSAAATEEEEVLGYNNNSTSLLLFDPDILASFAASSADGRTETASESDEWCRDAMASTSASLADEDVTSQWITATTTTRDHRAAAQEEEDQNQVSRSSSSSSPDQSATAWSKLSFAKIAPADLVGHDATTTATTALVEEDSQMMNRPLMKLRVVSSRLEAFERKCPPGGDERVVLYTTSLRGIRKTYEDCNSLRMIFQSYHVWIDERDVSMHANFLQELKMLLLSSSRAGGAAVGPVQVPRVFIMGHYIGGLEQVLPLHEEGKLGELLINLAPQPHPTACCDGCGGIRFVPCPDCSGSCKKINTQHNQITRCPDCNENGLIRCPICF
jgi:glutaredoxin domain-containing cysteine-rich protein 1